MFPNSHQYLDHARHAILPKAFRKVKKLRGHHLAVFTALFDHDSRRVITGSDDQLIKIWSTETGYLQHTLRGHIDDIVEIVKHPVRPIIVSASADSSLRVWNIITGAALHVLDGGSREVNAVQFSPCPDRPYVVSGGADGSVRLWNADNFKAGSIRVPIPEPYFPGGISTDTRTRSAVAGATSHVAPPSPMVDYQPGTSNTPSITTGGQRVIEDRSRAAPPSGSGQLQRSPSEALSLRGAAANSVVSASPGFGILCVAFNAGATRLAVGGTDCMAYLYAVDKDPDSESLFPTVRFLTKFRGHSDHIIQVLFARSGDSLITASRDGTARIWNRTKARLPTGKKPSKSVAGMGHFSSVILDCRPQMQADARSLLSGAATGSACGSIIPRVRRPSFPVAVDAALWSLTDEHVFTASSDAKIRMWDAATGKLVRALEAHESEVYVMDCHPQDKRVLLTAGYDGKCILWDVETGKQLKSFSVCENDRDPSSSVVPNVSDGQFSSDGLSFAVSDRSGALTIFSAGSVDSMALAPEEQFFAREGSSYRRDSENRAIDEETGLLLHLVPYGTLCDKDFRPYPPELQPQLPCLRKTFDENENEGTDDHEAPAGLSNTEQNNNLDALLQRAREFRENQEKEERRLMRRAREARRRMVLEKERAALEQDVIPFQMTLKEFEVLDSDYDDSDEDFKAENADVEMDSSSSSSEDEDEIRPGPLDQDDMDEDAIRPVHQPQRTSQRTSTRLGAERSRSGRKLRRQRFPRVRTDDSGNNDDDGNESPGYEVGSQEVDSENSDSSHEMPNNTRRRQANRVLTSGGKDPRISLPESGNRAGSLVAPPLSESRAREERESARLGGASMALSSKRITINLRTPTNSVLSTLKPGTLIERKSSDVGAQEPCSNDMDSRPEEPQGDAIEPRVGEHVGISAASVDRGDIATNAPSIGIYTPQNPSFTSERVDFQATGARSTKGAKEHADDTASSVRGSAIEEMLRSIEAAQAADQQNSSGEKSVQHQQIEVDQVETASKSDFAIAAHPTPSSMYGHEKSVLSDSPGQPVEQNWRNRTRSGAAKNSDFGELLDINEVAEREMQILDAEDYRKNTRKRRKRLRVDNSDDENLSDDSGRKRTKRDSEDGHGSSRRPRRRSGKGNPGSSGKQNDLTDVSERAGLSASAWLRTASQGYTYVPQVGDDVMYFPEGHSSAMSISRKTGIDPLLGLESYREADLLDGTAFARDSRPLRMQILDISYEFPVRRPLQKGSKMKQNGSSEQQNPETEKTVAMLHMRVLSGLRSLAGQNDQVVLAYYPVDAPEYLVLTSRVETALKRFWTISERFRILFLNEHRAWQYYSGTIRSVKPTIRTVMWNTVEVEYDIEGENEKTSELVSPWELEPCDPLQKVHETYFHPTQRASSVDPSLFHAIAREFEGIRKSESHWREHLSYLDSAESLASLPGYCNRIPFPMDMQTLTVRLCMGYYRHYCAFLHDMSLLKSNVVRYHGLSSEDGKILARVFTRLTEHAERLLGQYSPTPMNIPGQHSTHVSAPLLSGPRPIRPRPSPTESMLSGSNAANAFVQTSGRQGIGLQSSRAVSSACLTLQAVADMAGHHIAGQTRPWSGWRSPWSSAVHNYPPPNAGTGLPPVVPGMVAPGTTRGPRMSRGRTRETHRTVGGIGNSRRNSAASITRANIPSPIMSGHGMVTQVPGQVQAPPSYVYTPTNPNVVVVASSNSTLEAARGETRTRRVSIGGSPAQSIGSVRRRAEVGRGQAVGVVSSGETPIHQNAIISTSNGVPSPRQGQHGGVYGGNGASINIGQSAVYGASSRVQGRGGVGTGDGGTRSWGRSMEGAGGNLPLNASISDSHLPVVGNGQARRSPRPSSSSQRRRETANTVPGTQGSMRPSSQILPPYHEHSTVSVAAAESTMSCGGADVAMQAASAESAEVASERGG